MFWPGIHIPVFLYYWQHLLVLIVTSKTSKTAIEINQSTSEHSLFDIHLYFLTFQSVFFPQNNVKQHIITVQELTTQADFFKLTF